MYTYVTFKSQVNGFPYDRLASSVRPPYHLPINTFVHTHTLITVDIPESVQESIDDTRIRIDITSTEFGVFGFEFQRIERSQHVTFTFFDHVESVKQSIGRCVLLEYFATIVESLEQRVGDGSFGSRHDDKSCEFGSVG